MKSVLPVLMSAVRVSPPSNGPPHDGKVIGKDLVTYTYNQASISVYPYLYINILITHPPPLNFILQPTSIPSYLIAIASGNVRYKPFAKEEGRNWTSGIWAEPELIDAAYWEFSEDTNRYLKTEEDIVVPYRFGVYDLLVLPPSFPYGGMVSCLNKSGFEGF